MRRVIGETGVISNGQPPSEILMRCQAEAPVVDHDADGGDGQSWETAFNDLQDALAAAADPAVIEIRVAAGVYHPDGPGGDRAAVFQLRDGLEIKGGFAGPGQPDPPDFRDPSVYESILSGDLNDDDDPGGDPPMTDDNSYHVVNGNWTDPSAVIDGFAITAGNADGSLPHDGGAGMIIFRGDPTLRNCTFRGNSAFNFGGGLFNELSSPTVVHCTFIDNRAFLGGGVINLLESSPVMIDCRFDQNRASSAGGMVNITDSHPAIINCSFFGNVSFIGGGMRNLTRCNPLMVNCLFSGNSANTGGGLFNESDSNPELINCTFSRNEAAFESGGGGIRNQSANLRLTNCILWGNRDDGGANDDESAQVRTDDGIVTVDYSCIEGWTGELGGVGNIGDDPSFLDPDGQDDVVGTNDDDLRLTPGSPSIDAADGSSVPPDAHDLDADGDTDEPIPVDLKGHRRFVDDPATSDTGNPAPGGASVVDMGALEYIPGDGDDDGDTDLSDYSDLQDCFTGPAGGILPGCDLYDLDDDGDVDLTDWAVLQLAFAGSP